MSDLLVIAFPTEAKAEEVRKKLLDMRQEYLIELGDAVVADGSLVPRRWRKADSNSWSRFAWESILSSGTLLLCRVSLA
jgi:hypothetical protein